MTNRNTLVKICGSFKCFLFFLLLLFRITCMLKKPANFGAIYVVRVEFQWRYRHRLNAQLYCTILLVVLSSIGIMSAFYGSLTNCAWLN